MPRELLTKTALISQHRLWLQLAAHPYGHPINTRRQFAMSQSHRSTHLRPKNFNYMPITYIFVQPVFTEKKQFLSHVILDLFYLSFFYSCPCTKLTSKPFHHFIVIRIWLAMGQFLIVRLLFRPCTQGFCFPVFSTVITIPQSISPIVHAVRTPPSSSPIVEFSL